MANNMVTVTFSRLSGRAVSASVREGTSVKKLLEALKYGAQEIEAMSADLRINGEVVENILEHKLQANDFLLSVPNVKGGNA